MPDGGSTHRGAQGFDVLVEPPSAAFGATGAALAGKHLDERGVARGRSPLHQRQRKAIDKDPGDLGALRVGQAVGVGDQSARAKGSRPSIPGTGSDGSCTGPHIDITNAPSTASGPAPRSPNRGTRSPRRRGTPRSRGRCRCARPPVPPAGSASSSYHACVEASNPPAASCSRRWRRATLASAASDIDHAGTRDRHVAFDERPHLPALLVDPERTRDVVEPNVVQVLQHATSTR